MKSNRFLEGYDRAMRERREIDRSFYTSYDRDWFGNKSSKYDLLILPIEYYQLSILDILEETRNLLAAHNRDERVMINDFS